MKLADELGDYSGADVTALEWLNSNGIPERVQHIANASIGNENGTSIDRIGMTGLAEADNSWSSGEHNLLLAGGSHIQIMREIFSSVLDKIQTGWVVRSIDYSNEDIVLTNADGETVTGNKVILTIPLPLIADEYIEFTPEMPPKKLEAARAIGMGAGMKVILKFTERFWPEDLGSLIGGAMVPEYWSTGVGRSNENNVLTAFVHGANAEALSDSGLGPVDSCLQELGEMFGIEMATMQANLADSYVQNWGAEPFTRGTYSFPIPETGSARVDLAEHMVDKIYFAGEATNTNGHHATVHGAMETGARAVREILQSVSSE